jgi:hypothetical protein
MIAWDASLLGARHRARPGHYESHGRDRNGERKTGFFDSGRADGREVKESVGPPMMGELSEAGTLDVVGDGDRAES